MIYFLHDRIYTSMIDIAGKALLYNKVIHLLDHFTYSSNPHTRIFRE